MRRLTVIVSIILLFLFGYYIYDAEIQEKSENIIENIKWCPDNSKVALKFNNQYKIMDLKGKVLYTIEESLIKYKNYAWILKNDDWYFTEFKVDEPPKSLKPVEGKIDGTLYNPIYNSSGNIILDDEIINSKYYIIAVDKKTGEYNKIIYLEDASSIDLLYIDKYKTVIKVTENNIDKLYLLDINKGYNIYSLDNLNFSQALTKLSFKENGISIINNYKYNNIYVIYLNLKELNIIYKDLQTNNYYFIDLNNKFKIEVSDIYLALVDKNIIYAVSKTGDTFRIYKIDTKKNEYTNLYKSNNLIENIRLVNGQLYFTELNILNNISAYKLFKYYNGSITEVTLKD
ncbi:hypothetical protein [Thermobrachium celere]|uniref:DUF5050 domain-containing protein n=1 Tax=Thermobrachium celere DSM 8682 TaxID=941824 RepID=R7RQQ5_9CLOT|nr:hypothetical protein [Thermobrachium celere]CDF57580.1 hypothetical protein TCEL_01494 [Thermobrachium celere DSM 8682]